MPPEQDIGRGRFYCYTLLGAPALFVAAGLCVSVAAMVIDPAGYGSRGEAAAWNGVAVCIALVYATPVAVLLPALVP
jgi:hypothetical protein